MPTGYTAGVQTGEVTDFKKFAMTCARAFGACVTMRDDDSDAEIPEEFPVDDYHEKALAAARQDLIAFDAMSDADAIKAHAAFCADRVRFERETIELHSKERARYEAMLAKVEAWKAPSSDHAEFKAFMVQQLKESIKWDCYEIEPTKLPNVDTWKEIRRAELERSVAYHTEGRDKEIERTASRNLWLKQLRESLATSTTT